MKQGSAYVEVVWVRVDERLVRTGLKLGTPNSLAENDEPPDRNRDSVYHYNEGYNSDRTADLPDSNHSNLSPYSQSYDNHEPQLVSHVKTTFGHRPRYLACGCELRLGLNDTIASRFTVDQALSKSYIVHLEW